MAKTHLAKPIGHYLRFWAVVTCGLFALSLSGQAYAQNGERRDSVGRDVVDAVSQPLADLNIVSRDIPPLLRAAQADPYTVVGLSECPALRSEIVSYDEVLGPDADEEQEGASMLNSALNAGGNVIGGFIPFRGVVRQLSGANARRKEMEAAVFAGIARRSFLKGYALGLGCATSDEIAVESAESVLGIELSEPEY